MELLTRYLQKATCLQQELYDNHYSWCIFDKNDTEYLKNYLAEEIFGEPILAPASECATTDLNTKSEKIDYIINKILYYAVGYKRNIKCTVIFIMTFDLKNKLEKINKRIKYEDLKVDRIPVIKIKRKTNHREVEWFIDTDGRIFQTWEDYMQNNTLRPCSMVVPKDGIIQFSPDTGTIWLEYRKSPAIFVKTNVRQHDHCHRQWNNIVESDEVKIARCDILVSVKDFLPDGNWNFIVMNVFELAKILLERYDHEIPLIEQTGTLLLEAVWFIWKKMQEIILRLVLKEDVFIIVQTLLSNLYSYFKEFRQLIEGKIRTQALGQILGN